MQLDLQVLRLSGRLELSLAFFLGVDTAVTSSVFLLFFILSTATQTKRPQANVRRASLDRTHVRNRFHTVAQLCPP